MNKLLQLLFITSFLNAYPDIPDELTGEMLKEMPEEHVVELCGKKVWNEWLKENRPGKIFKFKKKEDKNDKNSK